MACYFPGFSLLALSFLNVLIHHTGTTGAIPLGAFFSLITFWFLISIPLCFSGQQQAQLPDSNARIALSSCAAASCMAGIPLGDPALI